MRLPIQIAALQAVLLVSKMLSSAFHPVPVLRVGVILRYPASQRCLAQPESVGIYNSHKELVKDAYWSFQTEPAKMSKSELDHCDYVLKALGHGDYHRGIVTAVAELTGIDCDKEHDHPNLTEAALKQCSPIWWPGIGHD